MADHGNILYKKYHNCVFLFFYLKKEVGSNISSLSGHLKCRSTVIAGQRSVLEGKSTARAIFNRDYLKMTLTIVPTSKPNL